MVEQVAYDGDIHEETTKTEASHAPVHISPQVLDAILTLQQATKDTSPDALLFQSTNKNGRSKRESQCAPVSGSREKFSPSRTRSESLSRLTSAQPAEQPPP
jgi:hypothetical protein